MRLTLQPNGQSRHHSPTSYIVDLPNNAIAILDLVDGQGWHLTVRHNGSITNRGMFGTLPEVIALLEAEYFPSRD